jgi:hypothetical protein
VIVGECDADGARISLPVINNVERWCAKSRSQSVEQTDDGLILLELCVHGARSAA